MFRPLGNPWLLFTLPLLAACGSSSGPVLERIKEVAPPDSNLRVDYFVVRDVQSCAIGEQCRSADPDLCFTLSDALGPRLWFSPESVQFVPPDSPRIAAAEQSGCFRLTIDDARATAIEAEFAELRQQAFQLSKGEINLGLHRHDIGPIDAGFKRWETRTGIFLQPETLEPVGLPLTTRETDYVYAVTGSADLSFGLSPKVDECAGTNSLARGFGATAYTWASEECATTSHLIWHFLAQSSIALRDVTRFPDVYRGNYPACGNNAADPTRWFPFVNDCRTDPDSPTCGEANCTTSRFIGHILDVHWSKELNFVGNRCRNGVADYDELAVDSGGVCDMLGR